MCEAYYGTKRVSEWLEESNAGSGCGMELLADFSRRVRSYAVVKADLTWADMLGLLLEATLALSKDEFYVRYEPVFFMLDNRKYITDLDEAVNLPRRSCWTRIWTLQ
jgi:hypothetical protein